MGRGAIKTVGGFRPQVPLVPTPSRYAYALGCGGSLREVARYTGNRLF